MECGAASAAFREFAPAKLMGASAPAQIIRQPATLESGGGSAALHTNDTSNQVA